MHLEAEHAGVLLEGHKRADPFAWGLDVRNPPLAISRSMWTLDANLLQLGVPPEGHKLADLHARGLGARKYGLQVS